MKEQGDFGLGIEGICDLGLNGKRRERFPGDLPAPAGKLRLSPGFYL
jgi:hypothetical protein